MDPSSSARSRSRSPLRRGGRVAYARRRQAEAAASSGSGGIRVAGGDPAPADTDPAREFRSHVARLYLSNKMSATDTVELVRKAQKAEAKGVDDLARAGGRRHVRQNAQRDLMRTLLRACTLPALYWASRPVYDTKTNTNTETQIPFLLPHEMMGPLVARGSGWQDEVINREPDSRLGKIMGELCDKFRLDPV